MNATATDRQARLSAALRENLKRRKRQTREREQDAAAPACDAPQPAPDAAPTVPERPDDLKGSD